MAREARPLFSDRGAVDAHIELASRRPRCWRERSSCEHPEPRRHARKRPRNAPWSLDVEREASRVETIGDGALARAPLRLEPVTWVSASVGSGRA